MESCGLQYNLGHSSILQVAATGAIGATGAVVHGRVAGVAHGDVIASVTTPTGTECKFFPIDTLSYIDKKTCMFLPYVLVHGLYQYFSNNCVQNIVGDTYPVVAVR